VGVISIPPTMPGIFIFLELPSRCPLFHLTVSL
jgi:hypothetical protein